MIKKERRSFSKEFKHQMVQLYLNGEPANEITEEYDLSPTSFGGANIVLSIRKKSSDFHVVRADGCTWL